MPERTRILLVDDQELIRYGFRLVLDAEDDLVVVGEASDGAEAVRAAGRLSPDVVLMDVRMPGTGGIEATRLLGESSPSMMACVVELVDGAAPMHAARQRPRLGIRIATTTRTGPPRGIRAPKSAAIQSAHR